MHHFLIKNARRRDEKILLFSSSFLIEFFLDDEKFIRFFSPLVSSKKHKSLSLVCVVLLYYTLYKKRARGGVKLFFSRFYNRIELLSLLFSERRERQSAQRREDSFAFKKRFRFCLAKTKQNANVDKQQRKRHSESGV